ncbi:MAG: hypothetical protein ACFFAO_20110 [Candidatus Hermodarchaeota archaeon]
MAKNKSKKSELDEKKSQLQNEEALKISDEILEEIIGHQRLLREALVEFEKAKKDNISEDEED